MGAGRKLNVLYLGMYWDYGDPQRGTSFEENSFHAALKAHPDVEVTHFDFLELAQRFGLEAMNARLLEVASTGEFDFLFYVPYQGEVDPAVLRTLSARGDLVTAAWGCDDHWRFENFSSLLAPSLNWWVTTAHSAVPKFHAMGYENVIKSQWAVEPTVYPRLDLERDIPVSFAGQPHGNRPQVLQFLHENGVPLAVFGTGWAGLESRITHEQMIELFARSRVCLNLSNSSVMGESQIKGRVFEVPGCGSLLLTDDADDLASYYTPGEEIVLYSGAPDLLAKVRELLANPERCERIAQAGYERTLRDHTWRHRFDAIFSQVGLGHLLSTPAPPTTRGRAVPEVQAQP